jgi:hypothetical protein
MDYDYDEIHVIAIDLIDKSAEILINYNGDPGIDIPIWFEVDG